MYHNATTTCPLIRIRAECVQDKVEQLTQLLETPPRKTILFRSQTWVGSDASVRLHNGFDTTAD